MDCAKENINCLVALSGQFSFLGWPRDIEDKMSARSAVSSLQVKIVCKTIQAWLYHVVVT